MAIWTAVTVTAQIELEDVVGSFLIDQGAPGLETTQRGTSVQLTGHFPSPANIDELRRFCDTIVDLFPGASRPSIECTELNDSDWGENWKDHFSPLALGRRLFVHPPWIETIPAGRVGIEIDPGMAFGTGHHASTRGCLCLLEQAFDEHPPVRVLDIGTGSGILAIAAAKLGAAETWAVEIDPEACQIAAENVRINGVASAVCVGASLEDAPGSFDVILANLFAFQLIDLAPRIASRLNPNGVAIGSGVLADEADDVRAAWSAAGLAPHGVYEEDGWVTLAFQAGPSPAASVSCQDVHRDS